MYSEIINQLSTVEDVAQLRAELATLESALFTNTKKSFEDILKSEVRDSISAIILRILTKEKMTPATLIKNLNDELAKIAIVELTIAFEPTRQNLDIFHAWLSENLNTPVVLNVHYDPKLVAGAVIIYKGLYRDFSVAKKIDAAVEAEFTNLFPSLAPTKAPAHAETKNTQKGSLAQTTTP